MHYIRTNCNARIQEGWYCIKFVHTIVAPSSSWNFNDLVTVALEGIVVFLCYIFSALTGCANPCVSIEGPACCSGFNMVHRWVLYEATKSYFIQ